MLRALDISILLALSPLLVPALVACATAVAVTSGRPVLFRQSRTGRFGEPFEMLKFRSMRNGPNPLVPDADCITPVGALLRRFSLDELPQVINVAKGDMSIVGPRPMLPDQADLMTDGHRVRHSVRPGLTGLAQVNGRNSLRWEERFAHDTDWARNPSVGRYLSILGRTVGVVVSGDGIDGHDPTDPVVDLAWQAIDAATASTVAIEETVIELPVTAADTGARSVPSHG